MFPLKTILHPTDLSELSESAHRTACFLARSQKARLIVLHVTPGEIADYLGKVSELTPEKTQEKVWEAIRQPRPEETGVSLEHNLEEGDPVKVILRVAQETRCDLIVMGTHGKTGLTRWFQGSVAEEVIRKASCSVLIVKDPGTAAEQEPIPHGAAQEENPAST